MDIMPLIALAALLLLFGIFTRGKGTPKFLRGLESSRNGEIDDTQPDFNQKFLDAGGEDRTPVDLVETFNPVDRMIIRSLLDSEGVETYIEASSLDTILPGVRFPGHSGSVIRIYEDKAGTAREIVEDFIADIKQDRAADINEKLKKLGDNAIGGYVIPPNQNRMMPKLLL